MTAVALSDTVAGLPGASAEGATFNATAAAAAAAAEQVDAVCRVLLGRVELRMERRTATSSATTLSTPTATATAAAATAAYADGGGATAAVAVAADGDAVADQEEEGEEGALVLGALVLADAGAARRRAAVAHARMLEGARLASLARMRQEVEAEDCD